MRIARRCFLLLNFILFLKHYVTLVESATPTPISTPTSRLQTPTFKSSPKSPPKLQKLASIEAPPSIPSTPNVPLSAGGDDSEDATSALLLATPRQSGSMVTHHDDVVTRMKNVEMIELGKHRIKPWYFAPYPQVSKIEMIHRGTLVFDSIVQ